MTSEQEALVLDNLGLVRHMVRRYWLNLTVRHAIGEWEDMIQVGTLGLITAAQKFRPELGYRFSTYATWWVRQAITRHRQNGLIHISGTALFESDRLKDGKPMPKNSGTGPAAVDRAKKAYTAQRVGHFADGSEEKLPDRGRRNQVDDAILGEKRERIEELLRQLDPRSRAVIVARFGLDGPPRILADIAEELGVTRQRIEQMEKLALARLRAAAARGGYGLRDCSGSIGIASRTGRPCSEQ